MQARVLVFLLQVDHIEFQSSSNVEFALNAAINLQPTEKQGDESH